LQLKRDDDEHEFLNGFVSFNYGTARGARPRIAVTEKAPSV
jgi:hypothetical protein